MTTTSARIFQWIGIMVIAAMLAVAYWYFSVRASTLNQSQIDLGTENLVGFWSFNGDDMSGTTATDRGTGGNNGTLTNGPTKVVGQVGQALDFDGSDDYVTVADSATLDVTASADLALSGWFNRDTFTTDDTIIAKRNGITATDTGYILYIDDATDQLIFEVSDGTDEYSITSQATFTSTGWHHFAVVWDQDTAANIKLFIDGIADSGPARSGTLANIGDLSNALAFRMGAESDNGNPFDGKIDEVRVYNATLTASQIQSRYEIGNKDKINSSVSQAQGTGHLDSGLTGYYKLDDGSGTSATDSSTNGSSGTLTGAGGVPTWTTGYIGGGVDFDGTDDYISTTKSIPSKGTVAAWVNAAYSLSPSATYVIFGGSVSGSNFQLQGNTFDSYNGWQFTMRGGSTTTLDAKGNLYTSDSEVQGWHHIAATWDTTQGISLYVDGILAGTDMRSTGTFGAMTYSIGRDTGGNYWNGDIDEARMYDRMLSADEISQLYRLTTPMAVDTGLKGYWSFNGQDVSGTTAYDRSGAGNSGTLTSGPTKVVGRVGQALSFDGVDDYVTVPDSASLSPTSAFTVSFWAKLAGTVSAANRPLVFKSASSAHTFSTFQRSTGTLQFFVPTSASDTGTYGTTNSTSIFVQNQWVHITVTFDGSGSGNAGRAKVYADGVEQTMTFTGTIPATVPDTTAALEMGNSDTSIGIGSSKFTGLLDEVRFYNRALSAAEIKAQYDAGKEDRVNSGASQSQGGLEAGLAGYWQLNEGTGTTTTDGSGQGNTGTLTNGPSWTTGQVGQALDFFPGGSDANAYVSIGDPASGILDFGPDNFSLGFWLKTTGYVNQGSSVNRPVFKKGNALSSGYGMEITSANKIQFTIGNGTTDYSSISPASINDDIWHYIAGVRSGSMMYLYVDGELVDSDSVSGSVSSSSGFYIGDDSNGTRNVDGLIDEVRVYSRALTQDEVRQLSFTSVTTNTDTSLKGYWSFNGQDLKGTTAYDRSAYRNTGTLTSSPGIAIGKVGQALVFDGTNYVTAADSTSLSPTAALTVSFWAKRTDTLASANRVYTAKSESSARTWGVSVQTTGAVRFYIASSGSDSSGNYVATTSTPITQNNWFHIVAVFDGSQSTDTTRAKIYVNGSLQTSTATGTINTSLTDTTSDLKIGYGGAGNYGSNFKGIIDEERVYNRALSADEIAALYNSSR